MHICAPTNHATHILCYKLNVPANKVERGRPAEFGEPQPAGGPLNFGAFNVNKKKRKERNCILFILNK